MIKINEAIDYARSKGKEITIKDLAMKWWTESEEHTAITNFGNLKSGRSKKIDIDLVPKICKELGVSADFLFGISSNPAPINYEGKLAIIREKLESIINTI